MNEDFETVFAAGGKLNTLGRADEVLQAVLNDHSRMDELYQCIFADDAWARMRAIDTFEKVCRVQPDWITPYAGRLLHDVAANDQPSVQWHLAEMFAEVELTPDERAQAITIMKRNLSTLDIDWIVAAHCMKTLASYVQKGRMPADELIPLLKIQQGHHSKSVVKKAAKLLEEMG